MPEAAASGPHLGISGRRLRLEGAGIIAGYRAVIDAPAVGLDIAAFIQVTLIAHSKANAERFKALVREQPEILEAYTLTGDADYMLRVVTADLAALARFVSDVLLPHGTVARVESRIVLDRLKEGGALPFGQTS